MSSTTRRVISSLRRRSHDGQRGQVLVLFAGGVLALLVVAALAFDVGMMLVERRDQQDAADAAALAGARYLFDGDCVAPTWTCARARAAATAVALQNGFDDADPNETVQILIPAQNGRYARFPNFVEVDINSQRPSIFGKVVGKTAWPVSVMAVASNGQDLKFPFSMLALNPTACKAIQVSGQGELEAFGNIQSNSNGSEAGCGGIGMSRTGGGEINIIADDATCRAAGTIQNQGSGTMTCTQAPGSFSLPDPLEGLPAPPKPALAAAMQPVGHTKAIPDYCPGSTTRPPTENATQGTCQPGGGSPASQYRDLAWVLSPGLYPNGLNIRNGNKVYLLPGIYWIGGGGFQVDGTSGSTATVMSIAVAADAKTNPALVTPGGGVLLYNSKLPAIPAGPISLGSGGGYLNIKSLKAPSTTDPNHAWDNMSIFQDRTVTQTVTLNGASAATEVEGIVYVPKGAVVVNGSNSDFTLDQIIADTFKVNGSTGTIHVLKRVGIDANITAAGLVD